jgi:dsRNA-specific ribonuclease
MPGTPLARGVGSTKKDAEQDAARLALAFLAAEQEESIDGVKLEEEEAASQ